MHGTYWIERTSNLVGRNEMGRLVYDAECKRDEAEGFYLWDTFLFRCAARDCCRRMRIEFPSNEFRVTTRFEPAWVSDYRKSHPE